MRNLWSAVYKTSIPITIHTSYLFLLTGIVYLWEPAAAENAAVFQLLPSGRGDVFADCLQTAVTLHTSFRKYKKRG